MPYPSSLHPPVPKSPPHISPQPPYLPPNTPPFSSRDLALYSHAPIFPPPASLLPLPSPLAIPLTPHVPPGLPHCLPVLPCASFCSPVRPSAPLCFPPANPTCANSHSDSSRSNGDIVRVTDPGAAGHAFFPPANPTCVPCTPSLPPCAPLCFPSLCVLLLPCASPLLTPHVSPVLPHFLPVLLFEQANNHTDSSRSNGDIIRANNHTDSSRSNGDIIRVTDPAAADVFFVPFLASLSFNIFTTNGMRGALAEKDKILQEELWSVLKESPWWQRSGGRDHIIPMLQPNALRHIRQRLAPAMFLLLDFGRYAQGVARLSKDIVVPYNHIAPPYTEPASYGEAQGPWEARTTLLFFQGTIMRKDEGYIRKLIFDMYHKEPDVRFVESKITGPQDIISAAEGLRNSRFCLNAAGDTPSSARLFDAIVSHCVPVVISNKIELPFETSIDYSDFTLFVSHEDALRQGYLLRLLRAFPRERWLRMWQNLQHVKHHFEFQYPSQPGDAVSMVWREIRKKLPRMRLAIHRGKRLVVRDWTNV
ncbi:unnamed protein product [Closterium sp. Naga37s-1]|nr:unnamed protein product [Closterium sp. Naga37s-1]